MLTEAVMLPVPVRVTVGESVMLPLAEGAIVPVDVDDADRERLMEMEPLAETDCSVRGQRQGARKS